MFLDTSFCIDLLREQARQREERATRKLKQLGSTPLYLSLFVLCELQAGAGLSEKPETEMKKVALFADIIEIVIPDRTFAVIYGETEAHLRKEGAPIPTMDLLIGVMARQHGIPLLTRDKRHYESIPALVLEYY